MKYSDFEIVISQKRMKRYLSSCGGDKRKAQTLYRYNLRLSQETFTVISYYEVALRNAIDIIMSDALGEDWIRDSRLLGVFPNKPKSSATMQYNNQFFFNELDAINRLRNRIAHHEPICFMQDSETISTSYLRNCYTRIVLLFTWMGIDAKSLLYGLDHIPQLTAKIDSL